MKHLVLGSSGQVGNYVVRRLGSSLLDGDHTIVPWDLTQGPEMDLRFGNQYLNEVMRGCDFVHFLAFDVGGSQYLAKYQDSFDFITNNMCIMDNVFTMLKQTKKPFYFTSSQMSNMSSSTYGRLKAVGESYTKALGGINVRFWNVYGVETDLSKSHVVTDFIRMAYQDKRIICRTTGEETRQMAFAGDVADILVDLSMLNANSYDHAASSTALNVTNGVWYSIRNVAKLIASVVGKDLGVDIPIYYSEKADQIQSITNTATAWPGKAFTPLDKGIEMVYEEMKRKNLLV